jgi:hypothetical protein
MVINQASGVSISASIVTEFPSASNWQVLSNEI